MRQENLNKTKSERECVSVGLTRNRDPAEKKWEEFFVVVEENEKERGGIGHDP